MAVLVVAALVLAGAAMFGSFRGAAPTPEGDSTDPGPQEGWERVAFSHGGNLLEGWLFLPATPAPHPGVVALMGSGPSTFRESWEEGYFPFWKELTESFVDRGYAVLLYDKPGVGRSTGNWRRQSFEDRADESLAAVRYLAGRPEIDLARVGLVGHSQGGWIALLAGARDRGSVAFLVTLAGPGVSVREQIEDDMVGGWRCRDMTPMGLSFRRGMLRMALGGLSRVAAVARPGYLSRIIRFDPDEALSEITQPTLALFAGNDPLVPPVRNAGRMESHFGRQVGNRMLSVRTIPEADHFFRPAPPCPSGPRAPGWAPGFFEALEDEAFWGWVAEPPRSSG